MKTFPAAQTGLQDLLRTNNVRVLLNKSKFKTLDSICVKYMFNYPVGVRYLYTCVSTEASAEDIGHYETI